MKQKSATKQKAHEPETQGQTHSGGTGMPRKAPEAKKVGNAILVKARACRCGAQAEGRGRRPAREGHGRGTFRCRRPSGRTVWVCNLVKVTKGKQPTATIESSDASPRPI